MSVSAVQPVAILSAEFCIVCSLFIDVEDAVADQVGEAYSRIGWVTAL